MFSTSGSLMALSLLSVCWPKWWTPKDFEQTKPRASKSAHKDTKPKDCVVLLPLEAESGPPPSKRLDTNCVQKGCLAERVT